MNPPSDLITRQLTELDDLINYYSTHPRSVGPDQDCMYRSGSNLEHACALGRYIPIEAYNPDWEEGHIASWLKTIANGQEAINKSTSELTNPFGHPTLDELVDFWTCLPTSFTSLGIPFLVEIQTLHDTTAYWLANKQGGHDLTPTGQQAVERLKQQILKGTLAPGLTPIDVANQLAKITAVWSAYHTELEVPNE